MINAQFVLEDQIKNALNAISHIFFINLIVCNLANQELIPISLHFNAFVLIFIIIIKRKKNLFLKIFLK